MLFVQQGNRGRQVQLAAEHRNIAAHVVQGVTVADQDAQRSLRRGGRHVQLNLAHDPLATIGTKYGLYGDLVARPGFSDIRTDVLETSKAALLYQIEIELHALDLGLLVRIVENPPEAISQRESHLQRRRSGTIGRCE